MNIIVAGCGKIGESIIQSLVSEDLNITTIDLDPIVIDEITNIYDVIGVCGNAADYETLAESGVDKADLFVAITGSDELNLLSCIMAEKMGAQYTVARIRNPQYTERGLGFMHNKLGLSMTINPELLTAKEIYNILKLPSAAKTEYFSRSNFEILEMKVKSTSPLVGMKLADVNSFCKSKMLVCLVQRGAEVYIPDGNFVINSDDRIHITIIPSEVPKLLKQIKAVRKQSKNIMIVGGSRISVYLAKMLINSGASVKIIESNRERCKHICDLLPNVVVINGDGASQELLMEEGIENIDAFVALTGTDEENILTSLFASSKNVSKVIAKVNRNEHAQMAENLGLDCVISPKETTSNVMIRYARALKNSLGSNVETLYKLADGKAEALEFNVVKESDITDVQIKDLSLKPNIFIAGIIRGKKTIIPSGDDVIKVGDRVIVTSSSQKLEDLTDILKS